MSESAASKLEQEHGAMSAAQTIYRIATRGTGVTGAVMQQIADAAYNALTVGEERV